MEQKDRQKIDHLCSQLLQDLDIFKLWPKLLENKVYNRDDVNIPHWLKTLTDTATVLDICSTIKTRGPHAYNNLITSLKESGHHHIAEKLENYSQSTNNINLSNNNFKENLKENKLEVPVLPIVPIQNSNLIDQHSKDDFHTKLDESYEPLIIKVKTADHFKDGPEYDHIEKYPMRSNPRGYVLIITNIEYDVLDHRPGAKYDKDNIKALFEQMGFKVITHTDLTGRAIKAKVKEFSQMKELRKVDSAFIVISSHGFGERGKQQTEIRGTDFKLTEYDPVFCTDIIDYFTTENCPNLSGKPKTFIFQTCRGDHHQKSVPRNATDSGISVFEDKNTPYEFSSRNYEDTLIAYATLPGHVSYRDKFNGSWFLQILCEVFMNHAHSVHLHDLFLMTDRRLKDLRANYDKCQTLWIVNQGFHKHCYLNPGLFKKKNESTK